MIDQNLIDQAEIRDVDDPIAPARQLFQIPKSVSGSDAIYFCGNSLGLLPKKASDYVVEELEAWKSLAVDAHFHAKRPWMPYHENLTHHLAKIVGGTPREVVAMNSLTVNLHLMMATFYKPTSERYQVVVERNLFPSDRYAIESHIKHRGIRDPDALVMLPLRDDSSVHDNQDVIDYLQRRQESVALILLGGVNYYSGQAFDMAAIAEAARTMNTPIGLDLAHAAGNVPLELHNWGVDFAVWCGYKYLNGGPGCIAGCFIHERHATQTYLPRLAGWWGHNKATRFEMPDQFQPEATAEGWQLSNPPILAMAPLLASCEIFNAYGMQALRTKSIALTEYLHALIDSSKVLQERVEIITPRHVDSRGCQFSLRISNGRQVFEHLQSKGIICDWREPDIIRIAPVPLYNTFSDLARFAVVLENFLNG